MRLTKLMAIALMLSSSSLVWAQGGGMQQGSAGMMNHQQMQEMQQNMTHMRDLMRQMHANPGPNNELMVEHMESMQNHMQMMRGGMMERHHMNGQGMMGNQGVPGSQGMQGRQGMRGEMDGSPARGSRDDRMQLMEQRLDQMQLMLEHQRQFQQQKMR